jgi:ParB-like chromosome segregation protein Spo0J
LIGNTSPANKISLIEDGWTQPIVARIDGEIVDGFHRWSLAMKDEDVRTLSDGKVPVVRLRAADDPAHQRMSTIRHNRARGSHHVVKMASIVNDLAASGLEDAEIARRLQMETEEVLRLKERGHMPSRGALPGFTDAWKPSMKEEGMAEFGVVGRTRKVREQHGETVEEDS